MKYFTTQKTHAPYGMYFIGLVISFIASLVGVDAALAATPTQVSTGSAHACAVVDGKAKCWGNNASGQLGNNSTSNASAPVEPYTRAAWTETTRVCTGINFAGNCIGGSWKDRVTNHPATPLYNKTITKVSTGQYHTCAVAGARVYCWGNNGDGRLGNNSTADSSRPVAVTAGALRGKEVIDVSAGNKFSCALATDGTVACWGDNSKGQLGTGNRNDSRIPVAVSQVNGSALKDKKVKKLAVLKGDGASTMCVIARDDTAVCWGENNVGQVGNGGATAGSGAGRGSYTLNQKNQCPRAKDYAESAAMRTVPANPRSDALLPTNVSTDLRFNDLIVSGGVSNKDDGSIFITSGDDDVYYSYVTAIVTSSPRDNGRSYYWGGSYTDRVTSTCTSNGNQTYGERSIANAEVSRYYFSKATPTGPLYSSTTANAVRGQQLALQSGDIIVGSNNEESGLCVTIDTNTLPIKFFSSYVTKCRQAPDLAGCVVTTVSRSNIHCDKNEYTNNTCTDNSNGTAADRNYLKSINAYVISCVAKGPEPVASGGSSWLQPGMNVTSLDTGTSVFSCAIANKTIGCWGEGSKGQLGNGAARDSAVPVKVSGI